jgi:hypothetical protein
LDIFFLCSANAQKNLAKKFACHKNGSKTLKGAKKFSAEKSEFFLKNCFFPHVRCAYRIFGQSRFKYAQSNFQKVSIIPTFHIHTLFQKLFWGGSKIVPISILS